MATYQEWNAAIGTHFFNEESAGENVVLTVDSATLKLAIENHLANEQFRNEGEAERDFCVAIHDELAQRSNHWVLTRQPANDEIPDCVGLLAYQVLAVFKLGGKWRRAYWKRVRQLGNIPIQLGYEFYDNHQRLWGTLHVWANETQEGRWGFLSLPDSDSGSHRHVRLPFSQALLRTEDLGKLDQFFKYCSLKPNGDLKVDRLKTLIRNHRHDHRFFGPHARRVLGDRERIDAATEQILRYYAAWDGQEGSLRRLASARQPRNVELKVAILQAKPRRVEFSLVSLATATTKQLNGAQVDYFLGKKEANSIIVESQQFNPRHARKILSVRDDATEEFITTRRGTKGDRIRLIIRREDISSWMANIRDYCGDHFKVCCAPVEPRDGDIPLTGLPAGWLLISAELIGDSAGSNKLWDSICDRHSTKLRPKGGIRLKGIEWLAGAAPLLEIVGPNIPAAVFVDGEELPVSSNPMFIPRLNEVGTYIVSLKALEHRPRHRLTIRTRENARAIAEPRSFVGICRTSGGWPSRQIVEPKIDGPELPHFCGLRIAGQWSSAERLTAEQSAVIQILGLPSNVLRRMDLPNHPIVQGLARYQPPRSQ